MRLFQDDFMLVVKTCGCTKSCASCSFSNLKRKRKKKKNRKIEEGEKEFEKSGKKNNQFL